MMVDRLDRHVRNLLRRKVEETASLCEVCVCGFPSGPGRSNAPNDEAGYMPATTAAFADPLPLQTRGEPYMRRRKRRWLLAEGASECEPVGQQLRSNCRRARQGALAAFH